MEKRKLLDKLKKIIINECDKGDEFTWEEIIDDEVLFGNSSRLELDSLDALQVSVALKNEFGIRIKGAKEIRKSMTSVSSLADFIISKKK